MSKNSSRSLAVVILAAGKGTRMKSDLPKVMHPLAGAPMISWLRGTVEGLKPDEIVVVIGPDMKDLKDTVAPHKTAVQKERNGTAGALAVGMTQLKGFKGDVLVLLGDTPLITPQTLKSLIKAKQGSATTGLSVLGTELPDPTGYGRLIMNDDGSLRHIVEHKDASAKERAVTLVNTGAFCIDGNRLPGWLSKVDNNNAQGELYITDLPYIAAQEGFHTSVAVTYDFAEVLGCNTRADLADLEGTLQKRLRRAVMQSGVNMIDPATVYLHFDTKIAPGVMIEPSVFFGPGVTVKEGAHIKAFCHLEGATIGKNVSIGPFARLRPGTTLGDDVRIGNFVEVKKSKVGARSKINHLGYVGDCIMGEDVNFSAGAITVNYDGFTKHETRIGKGVMVGSNANLIAPISIDDGAFVAAGSTITENVPADALSITRDVASIREGWAAEYRKRKAALVKKLKKKKKAG
jgi:bifunctional UDP-N-acetylglucosamine pyrophosphorylase/glucosamine-1-phosphate N-acetyltransferase